MVRYLVRKILGWLLMVFVATNITYFLASWLLDPRSNFLGRRPPIPEEQVLATLRPLNLDPTQPILERWWTWLQGIILHWDWGKTPIGTEVADEISFRIWVSARLVLFATFACVLIGVSLGVLAATRQYKKTDKILQAVNIIFHNLHIVVSALVFVWIAIKINSMAGTRVFFVTGANDPSVEGFFPRLVDSAQHLILPTIAIVAVGFSGYYFTQRLLLLDNINFDYVRTARAKGLTRSAAIRKHALRTSLIPVAVSVAFSIPGLFTGAVISETIFAWHGMGEYFLTSLAQNDVHGVVAVAAFGALMTAIGAILADITIVALDPRVRVS